LAQEVLTHGERGVIIAPEEVFLEVSVTMNGGIRNAPENDCAGGVIFGGKLAMDVPLNEELLCRREFFPEES
jgi:hypothetical protein